MKSSKNEVILNEQPQVFTFTTAKSEALDKTGLRFYTNVDAEKKVKDLTDAEEAALRKEVDNHLVEGELRREVNMNIKNKMEINSYEGVRHKKGLPVRGQRTSRNARTRKGKGKVVANKKKVGK